jgi:hypothetical protein
VEKKLREAFDLAADRISRKPSCASLFARLNADGLEMLTRTLYLPASERSELKVCGRSTRAYTEVGESVTKVCRRFSALSDEMAAVILIHEALHFAGLDERPHDPDAEMTPAQINTMVERSCGFRIK